MKNMTMKKMNTIMSASKACSLLCTSFSQNPMTRNRIIISRTVNIIYLILTVFLYVF